MKHKTSIGIIIGLIILFLIVLLIVGILLFQYNDTVREAFGRFLFGDEPTQIENGFTPELTEMLSEKYGLNIPENAEFIQGYYTNSFRDPAVIIEFSFCLPEESQKTDVLMSGTIFDQLLSGEKWDKTDIQINRCSQTSQSGSDISYTNRFDAQNDTFTYLEYNVSYDGYVTCRFYGHHPGNPIT